LLLYLAVLEQAISVVLVVERQKVQIPIYYISNALAGVDPSYPLIEKFAYALVLGSRKLHPYFKAHKVTTLADRPLKNVLQKLYASSKLAKWKVELLQYKVNFKARYDIDA